MLDTLWMGNSKLSPQQGKKAMEKSKSAADEMQKKIDDTWGKGTRMGYAGGTLKKKGDKKVEKTMHEFKHGELHSGSKEGPKVTDRAQAIAIALSQKRKVTGLSHKRKS